MKISLSCRWSKWQFSKKKYNFDKFSSLVFYCRTLPRAQHDDKWVKLKRNAPVTNCSPQIPHALASYRRRPYLLRGRLQTSSAMVVANMTAWRRIRLERHENYSQNCSQCHKRKMPFLTKRCKLDYVIKSEHTGAGSGDVDRIQLACMGSRNKFFWWTWE